MKRMAKEHWLLNKMRKKINYFLSPYGYEITRFVTKDLPPFLIDSDCNYKVLSSRDGTYHHIHTKRDLNNDISKIGR